MRVYQEGIKNQADDAVLPFETTEVATTPLIEDVQVLAIEMIDTTNAAESPADKKNSPKAMKKGTIMDDTSVYCICKSGARAQTVMQQALH